MKTAGDKIRIGGTWFEIVFRAEFRRLIPSLIVAEGSVGYARRNAKQSAIFDVIAPPKGSPEQLAAFYLSEAEGNRLLLAGKAADQSAGDLSEMWNLCWQNTIGRNLLNFDEPKETKKL